MKIALITDTHFGARNDSLIFNDFFKKFYEDIFFPTLKERKIKKIIHLGDVVDRRKFINYKTLNSMKEILFTPLEEMGCDMEIIVGNHDIYYKNTLAVNSMHELTKGMSRITVYNKPTEVSLDGKNTAVFLPWICADNEDETKTLIEKTRAPIAFGHLQIEGIEQHRGSIALDGLCVAVPDEFPTYAPEWLDTDGDDIGNNADTDDDNDGLNDTTEESSDPATDPLDPETEDDGYCDGPFNVTVNEIQICEVEDRDGDGIADDFDAFPDDINEWEDTDGDEIGNNADPDDDGDGYNDTVEISEGSDPLKFTSTPLDTDGDFDPDSTDPDDDNDGIPDNWDPLPLDPDGDFDEDGKLDREEYNPDSEGNPADSDSDGTNDMRQSESTSVKAGSTNVSQDRTWMENLCLALLLLLLLLIPLLISKYNNSLVYDPNPASYDLDD